MVDKFIESFSSRLTRKQYSRTLVALINDFPGSALKNLTPRELQGFIERRRESGYAIRSINSDIACLRSFYDFIEDEDEEYRSPARKLKPIPLPKRQPKSLDDEKVEAILRAVYQLVEGVCDDVDGLGESRSRSVASRYRDADFIRPQITRSEFALGRAESPRTVDKARQVPRLSVVRTRDRSA